MLISSIYICPIRGLARLEPPEPARLGQTARVAKDLGLERLELPVLEESLLGRTQSKVQFLDRLIEGLDQMNGAGLSAWLIAPARSVLGLDWVPPYLVKAIRDPSANSVFLEGRIRNLWPYNWWNDLSIIHNRILKFRELADAVSGHPALTGWIVMDRALEWPRPNPEVADLVLKSYLAEIRERDEKVSIHLGLCWSELLDPKMARALAQQVDGLRLSGLDSLMQALNRNEGLSGEISLASYLGTLSRWVFERPAEIEIGWRLSDEPGDLNETFGANGRLIRQGLDAVTWLNFIDPLPTLQAHPPWVLHPGMERLGLLDHVLEPKDWVEPLLETMGSAEMRWRHDDFIDISQKEYIHNPQTHFYRLWNHFVEAFS